MQFLPCARFCQNSSRFLAFGNCPAMPITAIADEAGEGGIAAALEMNRDAVRLRQEESLSPARFVGLWFGGVKVFSIASLTPAVAGMLWSGSLPCVSCST